MADEYISKQAFNDAIREAVRKYPNTFYNGLEVARQIAHELPAADVQPVRHGRWNEESPDCLDGDSVYVCSVCGETWTLIEGTPLDNNMHYCPNCGATMDKEE